MDCAETFLMDLKKETCFRVFVFILRSHKTLFTLEWQIRLVKLILNYPLTPRKSVICFTC